MTIVSEGTENSGDTGTVLECLEDQSHMNSLKQSSKLSDNLSMADVTDDHNSSVDSETEIVHA